MSPRLYFVALSFSSAVLPHLALAQDADDAHRNAEASAHGDGGVIIVSAQKRNQNLQDVPVSVSVVSAATLADNRVNGLDQLTQVAPSVNFTDSANTRGQGLSVRGIGTLNFSDGVEPSVSTVIDGVVIGRSAASFFDFNDLERIEVLRGPQGTLFGKNASAGVINIVTAKPDLNANQVEASASYGTFNDVRLKGSGSIVLDPGKLALRVSGFRSTADGIITNLYNGQKLNNVDTWGIRGKLLWQPDSDTSVYLTGDYSTSDRRCCVSTVRSVLSTTKYYTGQTRASLLAGQNLGTTNRTVNMDGNTFGDQNTSGVSLQVDRAVAGHTLTSITAYRTFYDYDNNDLDGTQLNIYNVNNARQRQKQFTQELRLSSPTGQRLEYVLGLFYSWQYIRTKTQVIGHGNGSIPASAYLGSEIDRDITNNNGAAFGQLTYHITEPISLIGGFRLTTEGAHANFARTTTAGASGPSSGAPYTSPELKFSHTDFSYKLGAQYQIMPDVMAYATYTRGYKGPAINMLNGLTSTVVDSGQAILKPEIAHNFEGGVRAQFFDRLLTLNVTGFHETFTNFQAQTYNSVLNSFTLANAGKLTSNGAEVEAIVRPLRGLNLSGNLAYTDTKVEGLQIACYAWQTSADGCVNGIQDVSGSSLANAPKWAFNLSAGYERDLGDTLRGHATLSYSYRSSVFFSYRDPNTTQPGYGLLNGTVGLETHDGRYRLTVWAKNLTNKHFASYISSGYNDTSSAGAGYTQLLTSDAFRTVGVEGAVRF